MTAEQLAAPAGEWIDVRDIALAHVLALEKEAASGQRFITSTGAFTYQDWRKSPSTCISETLY